MSTDGSDWFNLRAILQEEALFADDGDDAGDTAEGAASHG